MQEKVIIFGDTINHYIPSNDIKHNILFDTCTLNEIIKSNEMKNLIRELKFKGYNYYISDAQTRELSGIIDRKKVEIEINEKIYESNKKIFEFMNEIECKRVSCVALLLKKFWILDGSFRTLDNTSITYPMFEDIYNNNRHHIKDATIAEAAIYNNCTLVTNDNRLNKKVNKYFQGRSLMINDFVDSLKRLLVKENTINYKLSINFFAPLVRVFNKRFFNNYSTQFCNL